MRVVFFGTPEFAVPSLEALLGEGFDVAAVVTRPDKPQGRSRSTLVPSPVKVAALEEDVPVLEPEPPSTPEFLAEMRRLAPDVGVVVAYGHLLKPELLAIPKRGMVNVHPSLLPELRGAAPVAWAILRGLDKTGVTIMQMTAGLDSGPILHQLPHRIPTDISGGELSGHLAEMGAQALIETLALMEQKITRETARIDWDAGPDVVTRATLALDPKPGAWTTLEGQEVKLFRAGAANRAGKPGTVLETGDRLLVAAGDGAVVVGEVQPTGKSRMPAADWIRGRGVKAGQQFV